MECTTTCTCANALSTEYKCIDTYSHVNYIIQVMIMWKFCIQWGMLTFKKALPSKNKNGNVVVFMDYRDLH